MTATRTPRSSTPRSSISRATGAYLFGRRTYDELSQFWPFQPDENPMARTSTARRSTSSPIATTSSSGRTPRRLDGELVPGVQDVKSSTDGKVSVLGSGSIVQQLLDADLVDELQLFVHPLVLGAGHTLFPRHDMLAAIGAAVGRPHRDRSGVAHVPRGATDDRFQHGDRARGVGEHHVVPARELVQLEAGVDRALMRQVEAGQRRIGVAHVDLAQRIPAGGSYCVGSVWHLNGKSVRRGPTNGASGVGHAPLREERGARRDAPAVARVGDELPVARRGLGRLDVEEALARAGQEPGEVVIDARRSPARSATGPASTPA